jgi:hypothetical protein
MPKWNEKYSMTMSFSGEAATRPSSQNIPFSLWNPKFHYSRGDHNKILMSPGM